MTFPLSQRERGQGVRGCEASLALPPAPRGAFAAVDAPRAPSPPTPSPKRERGL